MYIYIYKKICRYMYIHIYTYDVYVNDIVRKCNLEWIVREHGRIDSLRGSHGREGDVCVHMQLGRVAGEHPKNGFFREEPCP